MQHNLSLVTKTSQNPWKPLQPSPPIQQVIEPRPPTAKPKDPDSYDFGDEQVAKDYRKMWEKYNEMEAMLKARTGEGQSTPPEG